MTRPARYRLSRIHADEVEIIDLGPWDEFSTVTNDAEGVVERVAASGLLTEGRRLFYIDSEGVRSELRHARGRFIGFG